MFETSSRTEPAYSFIEHRFIPTYEVTDDGKLEMFDPVWGRCTIGDEPGDEVFLSLVHTPLVRRSMAIEQLSLDAETATIPGTTQFSRWEHIWGSVILVRKVTENMQLDPRERLILQLRTFVSDLGHTAYSHLGDWMFQGSGGPEDQHDDELLTMLDAGGVIEVLNNHNIDPGKVVFPDVEDWIERPSPDLCVDRVDYGAREIKRWLDLLPGAYTKLTAQSFTVEDGHMIMASQELATQFAKSFLILATEHWSEPVHRLQLQMQEELVRDVILSEYSHILAINPFDYGSFHPRDVLFTTDGDLTREMGITWSLARLLRPLMRDMAAAKRRIFAEERKEQLTYYLGNETPHLPRPLEHYEYFVNRAGKLPLLPGFVSIYPVQTASDVPDFKQNDNALDFYLPPLKARHVDPLFRDKLGNIQRLSAADENFRELVRQQAEILKQAYVGRVHVNSETKHEIECIVALNHQEWPVALRRQRMPDKVMREMLHNSVGVAAMTRMVEFWPG